MLIFNHANSAIANINHCLSLGLTEADCEMSFNCAGHLCGKYEGITSNSKVIRTCLCCHGNKVSIAASHYHRFLFASWYLCTKYEVRTASISKVVHDYKSYQIYV